MGLIMLLDAGGNGILWLALVGALGLTYWDCRSSDMSWRMTLWWMSLVLLVHAAGYVALRFWLFSRRGHEGAVA
jgi:hypothetical protein